MKRISHVVCSAELFLIFRLFFKYFYGCSMIWKIVASGVRLFLCHNFTMVFEKLYKVMNLNGSFVCFDAVLLSKYYLSCFWVWLVNGYISRFPQVFQSKTVGRTWQPLEWALFSSWDGRCLWDTAGIVGVASITNAGLCLKFSRPVRLCHTLNCLFSVWIQSAYWQPGASEHKTPVGLSMNSVFFW